MAGEPYPGHSAHELSSGNETRSRLKTALKIFFWFSVLCIGLISLVSFFVYKKVQEFQANQARYQHEQHSASAVPNVPVDISIESSDDLDSNSDIDNTMPTNNEAAPATVPLAGPHKAAHEAAGLVINEIHFHPESSWDEPEDTRQEFIELYNAGTADISLEGYKLKKAVKFTFPSFTLPAGGYVVVAADRNVFQSQHRNVDSVLGDFTGKLSNSGEEIELEDAEGNTVDAVRYSDSGDWAKRQAEITTRSYGNGRSIFRSNVSRRTYRTGGWDWVNPADGDGFTLELKSAGISNQVGQNWEPSAKPGGTPGRKNSTYSPDIAPLISDAQHHPLIPTPTDTVTVTATIKDELDTGTNAQLFWKASNNSRTDSFKSQTMVAEGKTFIASIPPQEADTVIEFFIRSTDEAGHSRTWPAATDLGQAANALYQVEAQPDEPAPGFGLYRLVMTPKDYQNFQRMSRHTDAQVNATLIADDGAGPIVRYNCGVRYRGAGSRDHYPTPMRINLPGDRPWHGSTKMNLNSKYSWLQFIGMKIFSDAGERAPDMKPVTVRSNGQDLMLSGRRNGGHGQDGIKSYTETDYGYYVHAEPLGGEWVDKHFPEDDKGNCYKKVRPDTDWAYRNGRVSSYHDDGWSKTSNAAAADWSDLDQFLRVMNRAHREDNYLAQVEAVADLDQWYRWFGISALLANGEGGLAKGVDDDYGLYCGIEDSRFKILPHDLDTILARGDRSRIRDAYHTLFDFAERGEEIEPLEDLFDQDSVRLDYLREIHRLLLTTFEQERFEALIFNNLSSWVPEHEIQQINVWMSARRAYALSEVEVSLGQNLPSLPAPTSQGSLAAPLAPDLRISEVFASGDETNSDFIELHNAGATALDISRWRLSDNEKKPGKHQFEDNTIIPADGYLVIREADCGFRLEASGEAVYLFPPEGETAHDSIAFGSQIADASIGRIGEGGRTWTLNRPTPGAANVGQALGEPAQLRINEWMVHPHLRFDADFVEIFNRDERPVALGGVRITDDPINYPDRFEVPVLSFIAPRSFGLFKALGGDADKGNARHLPMKFAYEHGLICISGRNGAHIDQINYQCQRRDISQGRHQDGGAGFAYFSNPTPGSSNSAPPQQETGGNKSLRDSLRISEIMFHPIGHEGLEFIELVNAGSNPLNLKGVRFSLGIEFEFEDDYELAPGTCAVLAANAIEFAAEYGDDIPIAGEFKGKLSNKGETLQLKLPKPSEGLILSLEYDDKWQLDADGLGKSLELKDTKLSAQACAESSAWKASDEDRGTPGHL